MSKMIAQYSSDVENAKDKFPQGISEEVADEHMTYDATKISWNRGLRNDFIKLKSHSYDSSSVYNALYRPFTKTTAHFNRSFNDMVYQMHKFFPDQKAKNKVICVTGRGSTKEFSTLITDHLPDLEMISKGQCFPLYEYEKNDTSDLFIGSNNNGFSENETISDSVIKRLYQAYSSLEITKEDIFYYIYGLLHSEEYREKYADNLTKQLPRIPFMKIYQDFMAFSTAGRELAELHLNYEKVELNTDARLNEIIGLRLSE